MILKFNHIRNTIIVFRILFEYFQVKWRESAPFKVIYWKILCQNPFICVLLQGNGMVRDFEVVRIILNNG